LTPRSAASRVSCCPSRVFKRLFVLGNRLVALAVQVQHPAQVDVRPGEQARVLAGGQRLLESLDGLIGMAGEDGRPGQDEVGAGAVGYRSRYRKNRIASASAWRAMALAVATSPPPGAPRPGQSGQLARLAAPSTSPSASLSKSICGRDAPAGPRPCCRPSRRWCPQAGGVLLKLDQLLIEVLREHESLRHVVAHGGKRTASTFCW
jgi:hypothetical protein